MSEKTIEEIENSIVEDLRLAVHDTDMQICSGASVTPGHIMLKDGRMAEVTVRVNTLVKEWNDEDFRTAYLMEKAGMS